MSGTDSSSPPQPRTELLVALGRVVLEFGLLDEALHDALWFATDQRDETRVLTSGLRFPQLVERFEALYATFRDPVSGRGGVSELCAHLNSLNTDRNREMHAVWGFWADSGRPARTQRRLRKGSMSLKIETVEPATLEALVQRMSGATEKVWEIALDFQRQRRHDVDVPDR
jgi:hypothetical protein